jgi:hypothetical protein
MGCSETGRKDARAAKRDPTRAAPSRAACTRPLTAKASVAPSGEQTVSASQSRRQASIHHSESHTRHPLCRALLVGLRWRGGTARGGSALGKSLRGGVADASRGPRQTRTCRLGGELYCSHAFLKPHYRLAARVRIHASCARAGRQLRWPNTRHGRCASPVTSFLPATPPVQSLLRPATYP